MIFTDRQEAGQKLVSKLKQFKNNPHAIILALPRGGVVTAFEVAKALDLSLDLVVPRKISAPSNPEFAIGAIAEDGIGVFDTELISSYGISQEYIDKEIEKEKKEAQRRLKTYRGNKTPIDLQGKIAILVDDGIATGSTMLAAIASVKAKKAEKIVVAVPVTAKDSLKKIEKEVDEVIYLDAPLIFGAVGAFYKVFAQTTDEEVVTLMEKVNN